MSKQIIVDDSKFEHLLNCMAQLNFLPMSGMHADEPIIRASYLECREMWLNAQENCNATPPLMTDEYRHSCGSVNLKDDNFCGGCGEPLNEKAEKMFWEMVMNRPFPADYPVSGTVSGAITTGTLVASGNIDPFMPVFVNGDGTVSQANFEILPNVCHDCGVSGFAHTPTCNSQLTLIDPDVALLKAILDADPDEDDEPECDTPIFVEN